MYAGRFVWRSLLIVGIAVLTFFVSELIPPFKNYILDLAARSIFIAAVYGILILWTNASPDASQFWKNLLRRWK